MTDSQDHFNLGGKGALQEAIDETVNITATAPSVLNEQVNSSYFVHDGVSWPNVVSGYPGYMLQGDVLSAVGQYLSARSDTYRIRAYGDAATGSEESEEIRARAWCEVLVQRVPDYVNEDDNPVDDASIDINKVMGRRYEIVSFRWLNPEEI